MNRKDVITIEILLDLTRFSVCVCVCVRTLLVPFRRTRKNLHQLSERRMPLGIIEGSLNPSAPFST